ncbi:MAG TPA: Ig-like domain-containing protein [Pilimelia sp.]|nr:Ig-like domain-containing protein [Pilimelia sp.]
MRVSGRRHRPAPARRALVGLILGAALAVTAGCSGKGGTPSWQGGGSGGGDGSTQSQEPPGPQLGAAVTRPAPDSSGAPITTGVAFTTELATGEPKVEVTDPNGNAVPGRLAADGKSWQPNRSLRWGTRYTVAITVTGEDGKTATATSTFTTMAKPAKLVRVSTQIGDHAVVGVAMPLIVNFGRPIPQKLRDDVQRRMSVTAVPAQPGAWHWLSGTEVQYRPKKFWAANTKLTYRVDVEGLPLGDGWYGGPTLSVVASVGPALVMTVDNRTKQMTVTRDGRVVRTIPVSLGKPKTPSSSGTMVVMEKLRKTIFDTYRELGPEEGYRVKIDYAQRLTWGGEFIHSAPWSVADQGRRNVSHGCINMSPENAAWLFNQTRIGDPVIVKGTEVRLSQGNGWTAWNLSWDEWVRGSALPVE